MKLSDYQAAARSTAIYPESAKLAYPALGLVDELGELMEKLLKLQLQLNLGVEMDEATVNSWIDAVAGEIGDVLWYIANTASDAGLTLQECVGVGVDGEFNDIFDHEVRFSDVWVYFPVDEIELFRGSSPALLAMYCGSKIAAAAKKTLRDSEGEVTEARRDKIQQYLGHLIRLLVPMTSDIPGGLNAVAQKNVDKLLSRQERGVLTGDGDNR